MKESGVNIALGNRCSTRAYEWAKKTFKNRAYKPGMIGSQLDGSFSNVVLFGETQLGICSDGIGTKVELAERTQVYHTLGYDLVAMIVDDLVCSGFEPTTLSNILDVDYLDENIVAQLMLGLHDAANNAGISISGGEIAELGSRIHGYGHTMNFNWCATGIGVLPEYLPSVIDGSRIVPGQSVIAFQSQGFRSNGFSLIRNILTRQFGPLWHTIPYMDTTWGIDTTWGKALLEPSRIFAPVICHVLRKYPKAVMGIVHVTGGGLRDNFMRVLKKSNCGVVLEDIYDPLPIMTAIQSLGNVSDSDAYSYWNMGNAMFCIVDSAREMDILGCIHKQGYSAKAAGTILSTPGAFYIE